MSIVGTTGPSGVERLWSVPLAVVYRATTSAALEGETSGNRVLRRYLPFRTRWVSRWNAGAAYSVVEEVDASVYVGRML